MFLLEKMKFVVPLVFLASIVLVAAGLDFHFCSTGVPVPDPVVESMMRARERFFFWYSETDENF
jgi:hypothetical protein